MILVRTTSIQKFKRHLYTFLYTDLICTMIFSYKTIKYLVKLHCYFLLLITVLYLFIYLLIYFYLLFLFILIQCLLIYFNVINFFFFTLSQLCIDLFIHLVIYFNLFFYNSLIYLLLYCIDSGGFLTLFL